MEETTINLPAPQPSAGHAIYALTDVLRLIAGGLDDPRTKQAGAQELLFYPAQITKQHSTHSAASALMNFLMTPVVGGPNGTSGSKMRNHLKPV